MIGEHGGGDVQDRFLSARSTPDRTNRFARLEPRSIIAPGGDRRRVNGDSTGELDALCLFVALKDGGQVLTEVLNFLPSPHQRRAKDHCGCLDQWNQQTFDLKHLLWWKWAWTPMWDPLRRRTIAC